MNTKPLQKALAAILTAQERMTRVTLGAFAQVSKRLDKLERKADRALATSTKARKTAKAAKAATKTVRRAKPASEGRSPGAGRGRAASRRDPDAPITPDLTPSRPGGLRGRTWRRKPNDSSRLDYLPALLKYLLDLSNNRSLHDPRGYVVIARTTFCRGIANAGFPDILVGGAKGRLAFERVLGRLHTLKLASRKAGNIHLAAASAYTILRNKHSADVTGSTSSVSG